MRLFSKYFLILVIMGIALTGCTTIPATLCQTNHLLVTDLTQSAATRHTLLPNGTACPHEVY